MFEDNNVSINPVHFFSISAPCHYFPLNSKQFVFSKYLLPSSSALTAEESFAKIAMGWNEEGITAQVIVNRSSLHSFYPEVEVGDSVELFFDTRDLKTAGFNTRFCHHFFFSPCP